MKKKYKNFICRGCFKSKENAKSFTTGFCSIECYHKRKYKKRCLEHTEFQIVQIHFANDTWHLKEVCMNCGKGRGVECYISRDTLTPKQLAEIEIYDRTC